MDAKIPSKLHVSYPIELDAFAAVCVTYSLFIERIRAELHNAAKQWNT